MSEEKNREERLKTSLNDLLKKIFGGGIDYFQKIEEAGAWYELKNILADINNIITLRITRLFVNRLKDWEIIDEKAYEQILKKVNNTSANANGYDVKYDGDDVKIIAEIKCNTPVGKDSFGAAQTKGIEKDISGLRNGKRKLCPAGYLKFMVIMKVNKSCDAMDKLISKYSPEINFEILDSKPKQALSPDKIYIVFI